MAYRLNTLQWDGNANSDVDGGASELHWWERGFVLGVAEFFGGTEIGHGGGGKVGTQAGA